MIEIKTPDELEERIRALQQQRKNQWTGLKGNVSGTVENFKPANLIRNTLSGLSHNVDVKSDVLQAGVSFAAGALINLILGGSKNKPLKKGLKIVLVYAITSYVAKHRDEILAMGSSLLDTIKDKFSKDSNLEEEYPDDTDDTISTEEYDNSPTQEVMT